MNLRKTFSPPRYDEDERKHILSFLRVILISCIAITVTILATLVIFYSPQLPSSVTLPLLLLIVGELITWIFFVRQHIQTTSIVLVICLWAYITYASLVFGGVTNPVSSTMIILILIAGTLLGQFGIGLSFGLILATLVMAAIIRAANLLPAPLFLPPPFLQYLIYIGNIMVSALIMFFWYQNNRDSLEQIREEVYERKLAENALRESEAHYRNAIMAAEAIPYSLDYKSSTYTFMGEGIYNILGYSHEELTPDFFNSITRDSVMRGDLAEYPAKEALEMVRANALKDIIWRCDLCLMAKDGSLRWLSDAAIQLVDEDGNNIGSIGILQDITDRKKTEQILRNSEELYRQAIMSANAVPYSLDLRENRYTFIGENIVSMTGYTATELTPEIFYSLIQEAITGGAFSGMKVEQAMQYLRDGIITEETWQCDYRLVTRWGEELWFSDSAIVITDINGLPTGTIGILLDISKRKEAEAQVLKLNDELEKRVEIRTNELQETLRELDSFSYTVSHDLRAPLRAIHGYTRIMELDYAPFLNEEAVEYLRKIEKNAKTMGQLVDGLLTFSRIGRQPVKRQALNLKSIFEQALEELEEVERAKDVQIVIHNIPPCQADPGLMKQVASNLLSNAIKFTRSREKALIEIGVMNSGGGKPIYYVRDNGIGFDMQYVDKIFGVFQRLHIEEYYEGTGVGSAIIHRIITRHGGDIWAESQPDQGATFFFTIGWKPAKK